MDVLAFTLRRLGFEKDVGAAEEFAVDLSSSVHVAPTGNVSVPLDKVLGTVKFKRDLEMLEEVVRLTRDDSV